MNVGNICISKTSSLGTRVYISKISKEVRKDIISFLRITRPEVYSCARFSTLPLSKSVIPEMEKISPLNGQNMFLTWSFKWVLPESQLMCQGMLHAKNHFAN